MSVRAFLAQHDLAAFADSCERERLTIDDLREMSDDDLIAAIGMTRFADRRVLRSALAASSAPTQPAADPGATRMHTSNTGLGLTPEMAAPGDPLPERIGSYRVLGFVGSGGMGTVVRARHVEDGWAAQQGGDVAIKLIHPHIASSGEFRSRFMAEAAMGRRMQHAGLVSVYDVVSEGPWLGTVMDFVEGETLSARVTQGGLSVAEVVRLLAPLGAALDHLHAHGIVHRDVKPGNVVVRPDGTLVLLDLGIAKDTQRGDAQTRALTAMGTSAWMAPEQADAKTVDGAADRYPLGLMAYALLAGRLPWGSDVTEARALANKLTGSLEPLSSVRRDLPAAVCDAVSRMLSLDPGARFPSCRAFVEALQSGLGAGESALPASLPPVPAVSVAALPASPPGESARQEARAPIAPAENAPNRGVAAFLSFLVPGLGQLYARQWGEGAAFMFAGLVVWCSTVGSLGWAVHIVAAWRAYTTVPAASDRSGQ
jgi:serine/threonine protein kinase